MKLKTKQLSGRALNWAIADLIGVETWFDPKDNRLYHHDPEVDDSRTWSPSTKGGQGHDLIERYLVDTFHMEREPVVWEAEIQTGPMKRARSYGPTALVAAMRCILVAQRGEEIEIPDSMIESTGEPT